MNIKDPNTPPPFDPAAIRKPEFNTRQRADSSARRADRSVLITAFAIVVVLASLAIGSLLLAGPTSALGQIGKTPNEKAVMKWLNENEGDPDSVEIISIDGPRILFDASWIRVKYRSTGPMGGPIVSEVALRQTSNGMERSLTDHILIGWNNLPLPGETPDETRARRNDPLMDFIEEKVGKKN
jgi:hypothetical protein